MVPRAHFGPIPIGRVEISIDEPQVSLDARAWHAPHSRRPRAERFPNVGSAGGWRTFLFVPLRQQGELIGVLSARRIEVRPFTPAQIKLLETFADQAVIAIENVRLFQELKESLEQQTATSEILGVIASSPTDIQPVLDAVAENAARLCEAEDASIQSRRRRCPSSCRGALRTDANRGEPTAAQSRLTRRPSRDRPADNSHPRCYCRYSKPNSRKPRLGSKSLALEPLLVTPLLREGVAIGAIQIRRTEVRPFTDKQIALLRDLCRSGGDRHRERAVVQGTRRAQRGIARGAGASDGNGRGARHHQPLADGRAAGARRHRRERRAGLWDR